MKTIKWLHISDLHLNSVGVETKRLREKLPKYLETLKTKCDYIFCTGDIRHAPSGDFAENTLATIETLCNAVDVSLDHFFITPGNHDVDRDIDGRDAAIRNLYFRHDDEQTGYYCSTKGTINSSDLDLIRKGTENYESALRKIFIAQTSSSENQIQSFGPHKLIETNDFNIIILDSTLSYTKYQVRDLIIGTFYLQETLSSCNSKKTSILLTHYSFDFLNRTEQEIVLALLRDYNVHLWLAGHEHTNLARKQRDYFYEFQCGNLLLEHGARSCVLMGEINMETLTGQIQVHAWFSPSGWAVYPFVCETSHQPSIYSFNLTNREFETPSKKEVLRQRLRSEIMPVLMENQTIFHTYGPTPSNRNTVQSEFSRVWEEMIREKIIPNSLQVISLLKTQQFLLSQGEIDTLSKYEMHVYGLKENHSGSGQFKFDAPMFPTEILSILK